MSKKLTATISINIDAPVSRVWQALVDPALIKQYMFGTNAESDWKKGSKIKFKGEWNGKSYEDSGTIVDIIPEKLLYTTYYSPLSGKEDKPENYANVNYELEPAGNGTKLTVSQNNLEDEAAVNHSKQNWDMVLDGLKKLLEK